MNKISYVGLVLLLIAGTFFIFPNNASASQASARASFQKASDNFRRMKQNPRKRKFRHLWEKSIADFNRVTEKYPGSEYASKAMLAKSDALVGLYKLSGNHKDLDAAIESYEQLVSKYPGSADAGTAKARMQALTGVDSGIRAEKGPAAQAPAKDTEAKPAAPAAPATDEETEKVVFGQKTGLEQKHEISGDAGGVSGLLEVKDIRSWSNAGYTRVVLDVGGPVKLKTAKLKNPDRLIFDLKPAKLSPRLKAAKDIRDGILRNIRASQYRPDTVRVVLDLDSVSEYKTLLLPNPQRLVIDVSGRQSVAGRRHGPGRLITIRSAENTSNTQPLAAKAPEAAAVQQNFTSIQETSMKQAQPAQDAPPKEAAAEPAAAEALTDTPKPAFSKDAKAFCIGTIVIDPGHGGKDTGAIGKNGLQEKDVVLDIGQKLRDIISHELGCRVVMTRDRDVFIDLSARPGVAIKHDADLFVSIHANASLDRSAHGIETYLLNTTKDRNIMKLAASENMMTLDKMSDLYTIIKDLKLGPKREESLRLAHVVQASLVKDLHRHSRLASDKGVKQGPFFVLYGADMPSVLTEVGFISNPEEEEMLASPAYRQHIAEAIFDGIKDYIAGMKITATAKAD